VKSFTSALIRRREMQFFRCAEMQRGTQITRIISPAGDV
jgi:hypothetical protein